MIIIDTYEKALIELFEQCKLEHEVKPLDFGDIFFNGNGPHGLITIGIERKTMPDLMASMRSDRLMGHQLPGLIELFHRPYLLIEGKFGIDGDGMITGISKHDPGMRYSQMESYLASVEEIGVRVVRCASLQATCHWLLSRYQWWQKQWGQHKAHNVIYTPALVRNRWEKPTLCTQMAAQIPGIGQKAWQIGKYFKSAVSMVNGCEEEWMEALGIKHGREKVEKIVNSLRAE